MSNFILSIKGSLSVTKVWISSVVGAVGGFVARFLGGIDTLLITLFTFIVVDYVTGVIKAILEKRLSSAVGFKGIAKKILMLIMVGVAVALQKIMPLGVPLREMTVMFFVANEGLSILENASGFIPLPYKLKSVLFQIQKKSGEQPDSEGNRVSDEEQTKDE